MVLKKFQNICLGVGIEPIYIKLANVQCCPISTLTMLWNPLFYSIRLSGIFNSTMVLIWQVYCSIFYLAQ